MSTLMKNDKTIAGLVGDENPSMGQVINISEYTQSNPYIAPSDGYAYLGVASGENGLMWIKGASGSGVVAMGGAAGFWCCYVKKGMKIYPTNSPATARFAPLQ